MSELADQAQPPDRVIGFFGLGQMGLPMARRLMAAGFRVQGYDASASAREAFAEQGGIASTTPREAVTGAGAVVTMLPNGSIVRDVLVGPDGVAPGLKAGSLIIDMSSSAPFGTRELSATLATWHLAFIDAPVSGGVQRAVVGTLTIMAGGEAKDVERARPMLAAIGRLIFATGPVGSGHAMKALNNYVSASGLAAASEAVIVGRHFGLSPETVVDILNVSTGRNNSTETKIKPFVLSGAFSSGFLNGPDGQGHPYRGRTCRATRDLSSRNHADNQTLGRRIRQARWAS